MIEPQTADALPLADWTALPEDAASWNRFPAVRD
jgi:hypothetical protein